MINTIDLYYKQDNAFGKYMTAAGYNTATHYVYNLTEIPEDYQLLDCTTFENVTRNWQGLIIRQAPGYGAGGIKFPPKESMPTYQQELTLLDQDEVLL